MALDHRLPARLGDSARRKALLVLVRLAIGLLIPTLIYYGLRAASVSVYLSLLVSALISAAPTVVGLFRRKVNALSAYFTAMVLGSVAVSLVAGSTEFLLAKEAVLTFVTGFWFLASAFTRRPLSYTLSRPLMEGRFRWPSGWDRLWVRSPRWRRMWRVSSVMWGVGTITDAVVRVVMAYNPARRRSARPRHRPGAGDVGGAHRRDQRLLHRQRRVRSLLPALPGRARIHRRHAVNREINAGGY